MQQSAARVAERHLKAVIAIWSRRGLFICLFAQISRHYSRYILWTLAFYSWTMKTAKIVFPRAHIKNGSRLKLKFICDRRMLSSPDSWRKLCLVCLDPKPIQFSNIQVYSYKFIYTICINIFTCEHIPGVLKYLHTAHFCKILKCARKFARKQNDFLFYYYILYRIHGQIFKYMYIYKINVYYIYVNGTWVCAQHILLTYMLCILYATIIHNA